MHKQKRRAIIAPLIAIALVAGTTATAEAATKPADTVLRGGKIYTGVGKQRVQSVAIRNGRVVAAGTTRALRHLVGKRTKRINLRGRAAMPAIHDGHSHATSGGESLLSCDLGGASVTIAEARDLIADCLERSSDLEPDGWLSVRGLFIEALQPPGARPTKADLDSLTTQRPILVRSTSGHASWVNTRALTIAGITAATPDPSGGKIERDAQGEPTGVLFDSAGALVRSKIPPDTLEQRIAKAKASLAELRAKGVTSVFVPGGDESMLETWDHLRRSGDLTVRVSQAIRVEADELETPEQLKALTDSLSALRRKYQKGDVRVPGVKIFGDGLIGYPAQTGALLKPYWVNLGTAEQPNMQDVGSHLGSYFPESVIDQAVIALDKAGWQVHVHCMGDRCARETLDAFAAARAANGPSGLRHTITHLQVVDRADIPRFRRLGVIASMSLQWARRDSYELVTDGPYLGPERFGRVFPTKELRDAGAVIAGGSDWPVDPLIPFSQFESAITRTGEVDPEKGIFPGALNPDQGLTRWDSFRIHTANSAFQLHQERRTGKLAKGMRADLIVLNQNIMRVPVKRISDTKVDLTLLDGRVIYDRRRAKTSGSGTQPATTPIVGHDESRAHPEDQHPHSHG